MRELVIQEALERLRRDQREQREPLALELPLPMPYWPERPAGEEHENEDDSRGVVIIDMNDYSEVEG